MPGARPAVASGLDRLLREPQRWLRGRSFALVTNTAARDAAGRPGHELLRQICPGQLRLLMAPEHGLDGRAAAGDHVEDGAAVDGPHVLSLYSRVRRGPDASMLTAVAALLVDLQDIGVRYYTFLSTLLACLAASAAAGVPLVVLDRPNPLGGLVVEGPGLTSGYESFVGALDVPVRHGLSLGELATLAAARLGLPKEAVEVVPMEGWRREFTWADTGLVWYRPSPAANSLSMVRAYPATCLAEGTNLSEGRGTDLALEVVGAPWVDGVSLAHRLTQVGRAWQAAARARPATAGWPLATPAEFRPSSGKHAGRQCRGVRLDTAPAGASIAAGVALLAAVRAQARESFSWLAPSTVNSGAPHYHADLLAGGPWLRSALEQGVETADVGRTWTAAEQAHREASQPYLLYGSAAEWLAAGEEPVGMRITKPQPFSLDQVPPEEVVAAVVASACRALRAVDGARVDLARTIEAIAERLAAGGRLIYAGAGTSGRLGLLDASECEPTFGVRPGAVTGVLAGGPDALLRSVEGAEDDTRLGPAQLRELAAGASDVVVGIAASGRTAYTVATISEAARLGCLTVAVSGAPCSPLADAADYAVIVDAGPEPLSGSTRLGAGTAQKVVCNAITTGVFARLGYVYDDQMVGVQPLNAKLVARATEIISHLTGADPESAAAALAEARRHDPRLAVRVAIVMLRGQMAAGAAATLLAESGESLRKALEPAGQAIELDKGRSSGRRDPRVGGF